MKSAHRSRLFGIVFGVVAVAALAPVALACTCDSRIGTPIEARDRADAVFQGILINDSPVPNQPGIRQVEFLVQRSWKGVTTTKAVVFTADNTAQCGLDPGFHKDEPFLIYASGESELNTGLCTRTRPLSQAAEDLVALGPASSLPLVQENWTVVKSRY